MKNINETKKNLAILVPNLSGGGAERVASELSQFLEKAGHNVFIFTEKKHTHYFFAGQIILLKPKRIENELIDLIYLAKEIKKYKKKYQIDVSISFMEKYNMANILSKVKDKTILRICTTLSARKDLKGLYYNKKILKCLYNKADNIVVLSPHGKRDMINTYGIKRDKIKVIPNAAISRTFEKNSLWEYGDMVILSVNRIHSIKQQGILIDAMQEIVKVIPNAKLLLVGNDRDRYARKLKNLVGKFGLEKAVIFIGQVQNVEYYMYNSQVFVLTSLIEGFPNVVIESMNQGIPIISTDFVGPARELLGVSDKLGYGKYGIVGPRIDENKKDEQYYKNIKLFSNLIIEVLKNKEILQRYSEASKVRAKHFSKEKIESLWRSII